MSDKPTYPEKYHRWLKDNHLVKVDRPLRNHFDAVANAAKIGFEGSSFWHGLGRELPNFNDLYEANTSYGLVTRYDYKILTKTFDSFLLKTYRLNVLENENWPEEPDGGWLVPPDWVSKVNDVVRTTIIVNYLDGVDYLLGKIENLAKEYSINLSCEMEARFEGYYAAHLYYESDIEVPRRDFDTEVRVIRLEIQISTQIKEVIKTLLHKYYEERRIEFVEEKTNWQWNYRSDEFKTNYVGHMLHFIEGLIVEIRQRESEREP
jgi:hypothetical protein